MRQHRLTSIWNAFRKTVAVVTLLSLVLESGIAGNALSVFLPETAQAAAGIYRPINYQAKVTSINGSAVSDGRYNMRFKIYDAATSGTLKWSETWDNSTSRVTMTGGLFSVALGTHVTMTGSVDFNSDSLYLQVEFDPGNDGTYEETFSPRRRFGSVPYAHNANTLDGLDSRQFVRTDTGSTMSGTLTIKPNNASKIGLDILSTAKTAGTGGLRISTQGANHIVFGSGGSLYDVNLYRLRANVLKTDDSFYAAGTISGSVIKADALLASSGTLAIEGNANIDGSTFFVDAANNRVGVGTATPGLSFEAFGVGGAPATSGTSQIGSMRIGNGTTNAILDFGAYNDSGFGSWMQATDRSNLSATYPIVMQPNGGRVGIGIVSPDTALEVLGTASGQNLFATRSITGSHLYAASTFGGAGLADCDTAGTSKLLWDATTKTFSCGTDQNTQWSNTGALQARFDDRYVNVAGDTMTGALTINLQTGYLGLKVIQTASGSIFHAEKALTSSGLIIVESTIKQGSGALAVVQNAANATGAYIFAASAPLLALDAASTNQSNAHILFGYRGTFDTPLWRSATTTLSLGGHFLPGSTNTYDLGSNTMRWRDLYLSGSSLHIGTSGEEATIGYNTSADYLSLNSNGLGSAEMVVMSSGNVGIGTVGPRTALEVMGTVSGSNLYAAGSASGKHLYAASTFGGAGLADCDTAGTSKLLWDATTKRFSCGTDQNTNWSNTGALRTAFDDRYVNVSGDTMTGALAINVTSGTINTIGLRVINTFSGAIVQATQQLRSSGTLITESGAIFDGGTLYVDAANNRVGVNTTSFADPTGQPAIFAVGGGAQRLTYTGNFFSMTDGDAAVYLRADASYSGLGTMTDDAFGIFTNNLTRMTVSPTGNVGIGVVNGTPGSRLSVSGAVVISANGNLGSTAADAGLALEVIGTASGSNLFATKSITGSHLYAASTFGGAGLATCNASTSKLLYNSSTKKFECGTDQTGGGSVNTGALAADFNGRYVNVGGDTMTGALAINVQSGNINTIGLRVINTFSGAIIHAERLLSSSGTLSMDGQIFADNSTDSTTPGYSFEGDSDTGWQAFGPNQMMAVGGGTQLLWLDGSTTQIRLAQAGNAGTPFLVFSADSNTGLFQPADDQLAISAAGAERFRVDTQGIKVYGTASGNIIHASTLLRSSGTLVTESGATIGGNVTFTKAGTTTIGMSPLFSGGGRSLIVQAGAGLAIGGSLSLLGGTGDGGGNVTIQGGQGAADGGGNVYVLGGTDNIAGNVYVAGGDGASTDGYLILAHNGSAVVGTVGVGKVDPKSMLDVLGTVSGSNVYAARSMTGRHLYAASTFGGAGLASCNGSTSKLLYNTATKQFECGTDLTGAGGSNTGALQARFDDRYVNVSGDTMTGALAINVTGGNINTLGLRVINTFSGAIVQATQQLRSSGTLTVKSTARFQSGVVITRAEDTPFLTMRDSTNGKNVGLLTGSGSPEGAAIAGPGSLYSDSFNGKVWKKVTGTGPTGWTELASGSGNVHMGKMNRTAAQSIPNTTPTKIAFDTEEFDVGSIADASSADRFDIVRPGKYLVTAMWFTSNLDDGEAANVFIYKNGTPVAQEQGLSTGTDYFVSAGVTDVMDLAANDYLEMYVSQTEGGSVNTATNAETRPRMSVVQIDAVTSNGTGGGGSSLFTDGGPLTYLTDYTDNLLIGATGNASAKLEVIGTISGSELRIAGLITSSGSISAEGSVIAQSAGAGLIARNAAGQNRVYTNLNSDAGELILTDSLNSPDAKIAANGISYLMDGLAIGSTTADAGLALEVLGTASGTNLFATKSITGSHLYAASTFGGAGLATCNATSSKLLYNAATKQFECGTDQTGGGSVNTGALAGNFDGRYVNVGGDTMTGALVINVLNGNAATVGLEVIQTISGSTIFANNSLRSSGTLVVEGDANIGLGTLIVSTADQYVGVNNPGTLNAAVDIIMSGASNPGIEIKNNESSSPFLQLLSSSDVILATINADGGAVFNAGSLATADFRIEGDTTQYLFFADASADRVGIAKSNPKTTLDVLGTASGTNLFATKSITGSHLYAASTFGGAGLATCNASTSKLLYNSSTKKFECGTDQTGGGSVNTGALAADFNGRYVNIGGDTMTGALAINVQGGTINTIGLRVINTFSGAIVQATQQLRSSGTLAVEGQSTFQSGVTIRMAANKDFLRLYDTTNSDSISFKTGTGDPNGTVSAELGSLFFASNTGKLWKNNNGGTQWVEVTTGSGTVHMAKMADTVSNTLNATATKLVFDTEEFDVGDIADLSTDRITIKKAGRYLVTGSWGWAPNDPAPMAVMLYKNGSAFKTASTVSSDAAISIEATDVLNLAVNDYIELYGSCTTGSSCGTYTDADLRGRLSVVQLDGVAGNSGSPWTDGGSLTYLTDTADSVSIGALTADTKLEVIGTISGSALKITNLAAFSGAIVTESGATFDGGTLHIAAGPNRVGIGTTSPRTALEVLGTISGSNVYAAGSMSGKHLYAASTFGGAGLADCDTAGTSKLLWDATTKTFSCGTDQNTQWSNTGALRTAFDTRYVNVSGDTMTGALTINLQTGYLGLKVIQTASGSIFHAEKALTSSGLIIVESTIKQGSGALTVAQKAEYGTGAYVYASGATILALDSYVSGMDGARAPHISFGYRGTFDTSLWRSGYAQLMLSGSLLPALDDHFDLGSDANRWRDLYLGPGSLHIGASTENEGVISFNTLTNDMEFDVTGDGIPEFTILNGGVLRVDTISGSVIHAATSLASSGSLTWEGAASGSSLWVSTLAGAGLTDCDGDGQALGWDESTQRFVCGDDDASGSGLDQTDADERYVNTAGDTMTGSLVINGGGTAYLHIGGITGVSYNAISDYNSANYAGSDNDLYIEDILEVDGTAYIDGALRLNSTTFNTCTALETDNSGNITCGSDAAGGTNFTIYDGSSSENITDGETITFQDGSNIDVSVSGTQVTISFTNSSGYINSSDLSSALSGYITSSTADSNYVNVTGDTMNGTLVLSTGSPLQLSSGFSNCTALETDGSGYVTCGTDDVGGMAIGNSVGSGTNGSVLFIDGSGNLGQDNSAFYWNDGSNYLGVGTGSPSYTLDVNGDARVANNTILGDSSSDLVTFNAEVDSNIIPDAGDEDLGSNSQRWNNLYVGSVSASSAISGGTSNNGFHFADNNSFIGDNLTIGTQSPDGINLEVYGTMSGNHVHATDILTTSGSLAVQGGVKFLNYVSCSALETDSDGNLVCGTDDTGGGGSSWSNTGALQARFDNRYVNTSGDSMTGALAINVLGGTINTLGLRVINTFSGAIVQATKFLRSSGSLVTESGAIFDGGTLYVNAGTNKVGINGSTPKTTFEVFGTMSGSSLVVSRNSFFSGSGITFTSSGQTVFNEQSRNVDFRIESDNNTALFFLDASSDRIGIGTTAPKALLGVAGTISGSALTITGTMSGRNLFVTGTGSRANPILATLASRGAVGIGTNNPTERLTLSSGSMLINAGGMPVTLGGLDPGSGNSYIYDIAVQGDYTYMGYGSSSGDDFQIVSNSQPLTPTVEGGVELGGDVHGVAVAGKYAYVVQYNSSSAELAIFDISNPSSPAKLGSLELGRNVSDIQVQNNVAYLSMGTNFSSPELRAYDVSDPANIREVWQYSLLSVGANTIHLNGRYMYVGFANPSGNDLRIFDIQNPQKPVERGGVDFSGDVRSVYVSGKYAYIGLASISGNDFRIYDISDPTNPSSVGGLEIGGDVNAIQVAGRYAYLGLSSVTGTDFRIVDISAPASPRVTGGVDLSIAVLSLAVVGKTAYVGLASVSGNEYRILSLNGIDAPAAVIGAVSTNFLSVTENAIVANNLTVGNSLTVGAGGIQSQGPLTILTGSGGNGMTGALIRSRGKSGSLLALDAYMETEKTPQISFGYRGSFDVDMYRHTQGGLTIDNERSDTGYDALRIVTNYNSTNNTIFRVAGDGNSYTEGSFNGFGADYAEYFYSSTPGLKQGELVCIDVTRENTVKRCDRAADGNLIGIVSHPDQAAFIGNKFSVDGLQVPGTVLVGLIGQVKTKVMVQGGSGAIRAGDALTSASKPGFARKAGPGESTVGVALQALASGEGFIDVLISRRNQSLTVEAVEDKVLKTIAELEIGDEVQMMIADAMAGLDLNAEVQARVAEEMQAMDLDARIAGIVAEQLALHGAAGTDLSALEARLAALESRPTASGASSFNPATLSGTVALEYATIDKTLSVGSDLRVGGDLYLEGALMAPDLFVPGSVSVDGTLTANRAELGSGSSVNGLLTVNGELSVNGAIRMGSGSWMQLSDLFVDNSLYVMGDITIAGIATFLKDVTVRGELTVSGKQAGYAVIPASGSSVTVLFGSGGFRSKPVVTASPDVPVLYAVSKTTQTGFTIRIAGTATEAITFSWLALGTEDAVVVQGETGPAGITFPIDSLGYPISDNTVWNACIRNRTTLDADGLPYSCSRYHVDNVWTHPDLNISFTFNGNMTPPYLKLPEGYEEVVTQLVQELPADEPILLEASSSSLASAQSDGAGSTASSEAASSVDAVTSEAASSSSAAVSAAASSVQASEAASSAPASAQPASEAGSQAASEAPAAEPPAETDPPAAEGPAEEPAA